MANTKNLNFIERAKKLGYTIEPENIEKMGNSGYLVDMITIKENRKPCGENSKLNLEDNLEEDNLELNITAVTTKDGPKLVVSEFGSFQIEDGSYLLGQKAIKAYDNNIENTEKTTTNGDDGLVA